VGGWFSGRGSEADLAGGSFRKRDLEMAGGMVGQIRVREMRRKRYESPSHVLDRRSFADRNGFAPPVR
jgi:hypothetical protein